MANGRQNRARGIPSPTAGRKRRLAPPPHLLTKVGSQFWRGFLSVALLVGFLAGAAVALGLAYPDLWQWGRQSLSLGPSRQALKTLRLQPTPTPSATLPPFALNPQASRSYVPVIMYHDVVARRKEVWFDTTAAELRQHFEQIRAAGVTPIHIDQLYKHLRDGDPLPKKAILLTFDDAYLGQYENAYPLLKEFNYPAAYFPHTGFIGVKTSKDHFTWDQMKQMDREGLISFAAHTITHPPDLRTLDDTKLYRELLEPKKLLEQNLGHPIVYFAYPSGNRDERVKRAVAESGFLMAFTMDTGYAGQSPNLLEVRRFNQFLVTEALVGAHTSDGKTLSEYDLNVVTPLQVKTEVLDRVKTITIRGGRAATIHAEQRYNVATLMKRYQASAGINGGFFSIPWINSASNVMVGPVMSANTKTFIPGRPEDNKAIRGRPIVLLGKDRIRFLPFDPDTMNTLEGIQKKMPDVTDLFVAGIWLVKDGQPLSPAALASFRLNSASEFRPRAFFGVDQDGLLVMGATETRVNHETLAQILPETGIREAILLDSGFSTSLIYKDQVLATGHSTDLQPSRPVPHAILLYDLPQLWASQQSPPDPGPGSSLEGLVSLVLPANQAATRQTLQGVLSGQTTLRRGNRGPAIIAVQMGLVKLAASRGRTDLMPSGPDGSYGRELTQALLDLDLGTGEQVDAPALEKLLEAVKLAPPSVLVDAQVPRRIFDSKPTSKIAS